MAQKHESVLVVGGGIAGVTAAVEVAELGRQVFVVERSASLGGRVSAMKAYFPKLCPPACGLEINYRRLEQNPRVTVLNRCEVASIEGEPGNLAVKLTRRPSYVKPECRDPVKPFEKLNATLPDPFNYGLAQRRPVGLAHPHAWPQEPFVMPEALESAETKSQLESLDCVDLGQKPEQFELWVGSIIWATGWKPYDAAAIDYLGYSAYPDVVSNVEFERLAAPDGPNAGELKRPSDGQPVKKVAFVQCAGSRDANHLPYCSAVCCLASLKQSTYVLDACEDAEAWMFYIDIRAGRYESFLQRLQQNERMHLVMGKVGLVEATGSGTYR
ncbi:MAG: CoB--CoM heterodisulfide reductase iron-sulfur subunit A family protein, partial [Deltaproteobacteria bacterium]